MTTMDETTNFHHQNNSVQEQIRTLTRHVDELMELLRNQRDILLTRGMNLPTGSIDNLRLLRTRLDDLNKGIINTQIELNQLRELARTTALIASSLEVGEVLNQVMDTVIRLTGAERGYIMLKNKVTGEMEFRIARGMDREQLSKEDFIVSRTIVNDVSTTGQAVMTSNASQDQRYGGAESVVGFRLLSILAVPLQVRKEIIGVVYCDNRILAGLFKEHELNLLRAFANQAAVAIENAYLFEDARARLAEATQMRDLMDNIFTSIVSGVITVKSDDVIITYNAAAARILGAAAEEAIGNRLHDLLAVAIANDSFDRDEFDKHLENVRQNEAQAFMEAEPVLGDLGKRYWNLRLSPLRDEDQDQGVAIVVDDLTEIREREAQLAAVRIYLPGALLEHIRSIDMSEVGGQEREITAIFADVRGFTTFSEQLEPEELMRVINDYLSVASDSINLYEGIVDKYMGDAVTGLFNTQLNPQEDHALRAVRAAMSILYDLFALHEVLSEEKRLFFGIGIHTGLAVLGNVGGKDRKEFAAMGEATIMSKLLQENAGPGEIMISADTYEQVKHQFECEPQTPRKNGGREDFTVIYKVTGRKRTMKTGMLVNPAGN